MMRRMASAAAGLIALCLAGGAIAGQFDGVYVTAPDGSAADRDGCRSVPILITSEKVTYFEMRCDLENPVQIRAMDGVLYDGTCWLDRAGRGAAKQGRVLIRRMASGDVALVTPFMDVRLAACRVEG